ncbi:unnamed protein product (macronuclear) [Paramecium tetraurelia]|uniref:FCP1 homology domain-containing protein n=1 Tax=Paramecium tetraurelia TaxID=5888 RepID=A0BKE2_PARTE|nr:uncharacterized protein GSPATT00029640001 [Paramecium tetraurelia]CAK59009.1 unnamed protein product [Paramecium tetraurelia]|eukprot:XP_001426407.1 hypothetical protein (macronuclear) [Paramecium tetraurelia strain d4-2]
MKKTTLNYSCTNLFQKQNQFDNVNIGIFIDKENSYAGLQKKKKLQNRDTTNQTQQKTDLRSNSALQKSSSLSQFYRPSSSNDKHSYQHQNTYAYLKDMKNQSCTQQLQQSSYQKRHTSSKQVKEHNSKQVQYPYNIQLRVNSLEIYEDKKLKLKLMKSSLEKQQNLKSKDYSEFNNQQIQDIKTENQKYQGLLAKYFQINQHKSADEKKQSKDVKQIYNMYPQIKDIKHCYTNSLKQTQEKKRGQLQEFVTQLNVDTFRDTQKLQMSNTLIKSDRQKLNDVKSTHLNKISVTQENEPFLYYISSVISALNIKEQNKYDEKVRDHLAQTYQGLLFAGQFDLNFDEDKIVSLPRSNNLKTIVFDLDETLIHCNENAQIPGDVILPITFPNGETVQASINIRPHAQKVLQTLSKHFEIIIFTASHSSYANIVIDYLDPKRQWISHRLFRENCVQTPEGAYVKDLRVLGNRKLSNVLLVDNASYSFGKQIENGVPIISFYDNYDDQELLHLQNYLLSFRHEKDVRDLNQRMLKLNQFINYKELKELLQGLFEMYI